MSRKTFTDEDRRKWANYARNHGEQAAANKAGVKKPTIQQWMRDYPGSGPSVPTVPSRRHRGSRQQPTPRPPHAKTRTNSKKAGHTAVEEVADALAKDIRAWFRKGRKRRRAADELKAIISDWEQSRTQDDLADANVFQTPVQHPEMSQAPPSRDSSQRQTSQQTGARSSDTCNVYVIDAGLLTSLARNDQDSRKFLKAVVDETNAVFVPTGAVGCRFRDAPPHEYLARVLGAEFVQLVSFDAVLARDAGILCRAAGTGDVIGASIVVTARACRRILNRKRSWNKCTTYIVTKDVINMKRFLQPAGLRLAGQGLSHNQNLLAVELS